MKKSLYKLTALLLIAAAFIQTNVTAQSYLNFSKYAGGSGEENQSPVMKVVNGETYLLNTTTSPDITVTNGSTYKGMQDMVLFKYSSNGTLLYATYLGSPGSDIAQGLTIVNGEAYISGSCNAAGYPVTNATAFGGATDVVITKIGTTGNIVFSTYLGGLAEDNLGPIFSSTKSLIISGNELFISGSTASFNFPHTMGGNMHGDPYDCFITKMNASTGAIIQSTFIGGNKSDINRTLILENGFLYLALTSYSTDIPITMGAPYSNLFNDEPYIIKLNSTDLSTVYSRFVGPNDIAYNFYVNMQVVNGEVYLHGSTYSDNYPVTNGTVASSGAVNGYPDGFFTRLNTDGSIGFSTYLSTEGSDLIYRMKISNGVTYLVGPGFNFDNGEVYLEVYKINANGSFVYSKKIITGNATGNSIDLGYLDFEEVGGELYLFGTAHYPEFPVTNNSQFYAPDAGYFMHLDGSGDIVYSSFLGKMNFLFLEKYANNKFYLLGGSDAPTYPVTDSSTIQGSSDHLLIQLNPDGSNYFSSYIGGNGYDFATSMDVFNNDVYCSGTTYSNTYPVTENKLLAGGSDMFVTKVSFCPTNYLLSNDTLSPKTQSVCKYGLAQKIIGQEVTVPGDSLPTIYRNGVASKQRPIGTSYQWQVATSVTGPYTNIPNATFKDYTPVLGSVNQYYRRQAFASAQCGGGLVHTSDTSTAMANSLTAPTLNLSGPYITCPGTSIPISGAPTATGGNPPYTSYEWDNGLPAVANPSVSPVLNSLYTLVVTDAAGCKQIGQALVNTFTANAGFNKGNCAGNGVKIGSPAFIGVPGIVYNWQPAATLTNTAVAQPYANPLVTTDYSLTLTVSKSGGGTCITKDTMTVTPVAAPVTPDFAGPDRIICFNAGDTAHLGTAPEPGFNYVWSPGSYLTSNITSTTNYYPGNLLMPYPNPAIIHLTAQKSGCFFTDDVEVATIESRAGLTGCGPRYVGFGDRTPNIDETYQWALVSGPGHFTGVTNLPQVPVSASVGGTSVYGLTVSYNGHSCYSSVVVPDTCGCGLFIFADAFYKCPSFSVNYGDVTLNAISNVSDGIYTWQPQQGLSNYTGASVHLTDNVPRTYTVTVTSASDSNLHCELEIQVNDPAFSRPVFDTHDTVTCANQPVMIGGTNVAGFTYSWGGTGLSDISISNPVAIVPVYTQFPVLVTDGNGCELRDTVTVNVETVNAAAGDDWVICNSGVVKLGTPAQPNTSYVWEPQIAPWQNGTDQYSAQPEVLVATDITFYVTATTPAGCLVQDSVTVTINNSPTIADAPNVIVCKGSSGTIGLPALPGVFYDWSPATGLSDHNAAQPTVTPLVNTIYTLTATFPGGCSLPATDNVTVTISDPDFHMPDISFCPASGTPLQLGNAAPAGMLQYNWNNGNYYAVSDPYIANPTANNLSATTASTYTLAVISNYGCAAVDTIIVTPVITPPNAGNDVIICKNDTTRIGNAGNTIDAAVSYHWSPATNLSDATSINPLFTGTTAGTFTYYLTKNSSSPACALTDSVLVKVEDLVLPAMNAPVVCQNSCVQIGTTPLNNVQYQWIPATGLSNANIANPVACVGISTTTYHLSAHSISGCNATASVLVTVSSLSSAQITIPPVIACLNDSIAQFNPVVNPAGPYSFLWSPDDGTLSNVNILNPLISITGTGNKQYSLQVTDTITGCSNSAVGNFTVNNCPTTASIGDFMWFDTDGNGVQDVTELGVANMDIKLYNNSGYHIATATTNANGYYSFANISAGNGYYVVFNKPAGYSFTVQNTGGIAALNNSKADAAGRSSSFTIPAGINILNIDAGIRPTGTTPVTLLSFTGTLQNNVVLLNWQTTAEYNNHYFDMERSSDGINFVAIGRVNGNGTTSLPHSYSFIDAHPLNGINYYRLRQADLNGHFKYSSIVAVRVSSGNITAIYNSQANTILISCNHPDGGYEIRLYASNGQLVKSAAAGNATSYTMELPMLANGIYILHVVNSQGIFMEKVFIRR